MNKLLIGILAGIIAIILLLVNLTSTLRNYPYKLGSVSPELSSVLASTSVVSVGLANNGVLLFPLSPNCAARAISTKDKAIVLMFGNNSTQASTTLNNRFGHLQAASTTVIYDGGTYGCDAWYAFGFDSTTSITTSEFR